MKDPNKLDGPVVRLVVGPKLRPQHRKKPGLRSCSGRFPCSGLVVRGRVELPTFRFSGRTYPQLARIVRGLCAAAGRCSSPLVVAVAVTVAVSRDPPTGRACCGALRCPVRHRSGPTPPVAEDGTVLALAEYTSQTRTGTRRINEKRDVVVKRIRWGYKN